MASTVSPSQDSKFVQDGKTIDHTPGSAVVAGDVVVVGTHPLPALSDIASGALGALAAEGIFDFAQINGGAGFSAGDTAYWDANGTSVADIAAGDTLSGCVTSVAGDGELLGMVAKDSDAADTNVRVRLTNVELTATLAGSVTVSDITGSDSILTISGLDAATSGNGGTIVNVAGDGHTNGDGGLASYTAGDGIGSGDGGAASVVGGAAPGTGDGGAALLTGGATTGGATGTGGAATIAGGASGNATNGAGGVASVTGGAGKGSGNGAAASITGGAGGTTGTGGASSLVAGASAGAGGTAGAVNIDAGAAAGGTGAGVAIGTTNATTLALGISTAKTTASAPINYGAAGGAADVQTLTLAPAIDAYATGQMFFFRPVADNTGACTLNVNGKGAKDIKTQTGADPAAGDLEGTTGIAMVIYDGSNMVLMNPATTTD